MSEVRHATPADTPAIVATLAAAFHDDPVFAWLFPDEPRRQAKMLRLFALLHGVDTRLGRIVTVDDGAAASFWRAPKTAINPPGELLRGALPLLGVFGTAIGKALRLSRAIEHHMPPGGNFLYAHFVGVRPDRQGEGLGAAMMRDGIARAQSLGVPLYLETARPKNVSFYTGLGFAVTGEWDVPKGGPHFWSMQHGL